MRSDVLTPVFKGFTALGYSGFLFIFLPVGYWVFSKNIFARMGLFLLLSAILNAYLKDVFQDPRPGPVFQMDAGVGESFGFPSGHAQIAVVVWFWIAWEARKSWMWMLSVILVTGICFSRLYLGVHDVEDVLGGMAVGFISLLLFMTITSDRFDGWHRCHPLWHILAIVAVCLLFFITWPGELPGGMIGFGVFLLGFWSGVILERKKIFFVKHDQLWRVLLSGVIGVFVFLLLQKGFREAGLWLTSGKPYIDLFQAFLLGVYITAFAPWIFQKLRLAL